MNHRSKEKDSSLISKAVLCLALILLLALPLVQAAAAPHNQEASGAEEVIAAVNLLREANGLPALKVNKALMSAAQEHSEYMAYIGAWTHKGLNNSLPEDRALEAGYGDGESFVIFENIASGRIQPAGAMKVWLEDGRNLSVLLLPEGVDVGAGAAAGHGGAFYTLLVGYVVEEANATPPSLPNEGSTPFPVTPAPTATPRGEKPVLTAVPEKNGSIIHEVEAGQTLFSIALAYGIGLDQLLAQNGLTPDAVIFPGNKLVIRPANTRTPSPEPSATMQQATATRRPTRTPTVTPAPGALLASPQPPVTAVSPSPSRPPLSDPLVLTIIVLAAIGVSLLLIGTLLKRGKS